MEQIGANIINHIAEFLQPRDLCAFMLTCRGINSIVRKTYLRVKAKYVNHLWYLINEFPNANWNWKGISANANITPEHIINNPGLPWDLAAFSANPNITPEFVMLPGVAEKLNWILLSKNPGIPISFILANHGFPWHQLFVGMRKDITLTLVIMNPGVDWVVAYNKHLTLSEKLACHGLDSYNDLTPGMVGVNDPDEFKIMRYRQTNDPNWLMYASPELIDVFPTFPWNAVAWSLSDHPKLTADIILRHINLKWDPFLIQKTLSSEELEKLPEFMHDIEIKSDDDVRKILDKEEIKYNIKALLRFNKIIDLDIAKRITSPPELLAEYQHNPMLTYWDVIDNPGIAWDFNAISFNEFQKSKDYHSDENIHRRLDTIHF